MTEAEKIEFLLKAFYANNGTIKGFVYAATKNHHVTEEILQTVAITVAQKANVFDMNRDAKSWIMGIARNRIQRWYEESALHRKRSVSFDVLELCLPNFESFDSDHVVQRKEALSNCLSRLPERQKALIELRYVDDHDCLHIANEFGRSVQSIYALLKRLKLELRKCVEFQVNKPAASI